MLRILNIKKINNETLYKIEIILELDSNIIQNILINSNLNTLFFNENTYELNINNELIKLNSNIENKNIDYKERIENIFKNNYENIFNTLINQNQSSNTIINPINQNNKSNVFKSNLIEVANYELKLKNNVVKEYDSIINDLKEEVVNEFYEKNSFDLGKNISKENIMDNYIIQVDIKHNMFDNFAIVLNPEDEKISKNKFLENNLQFKNLIDNNKKIIGDVNKEKILDKNILVSTNISIELLNKLMENQHDKEYVKSFKSMFKNLALHELSHGFLKTSEIGAVEQQIYNITSDKFKKDLINASIIPLEKEINFYKSKFSSNIESILNNEISKKTNENLKAHEKIKSILMDPNEKEIYLFNESALESINTYYSGDRKPDKQKYVHGNEYGNVIAKEQIVASYNLGIFEHNKVSDEYKEKMYYFDFAGGTIFNSMIHLHEKNLSKDEINIFNELVSKELFYQVIREKFDSENEQHKIIFNSIQNKIEKMSDKAKEKSINFDLNPKISLEDLY